MRLMIFIKSTILILSLCFLFGCGENYEPISSSLVIPKQKNVLGDTLIKDSVRGRVFSRLYKHATAGLQFQYDIPKEYQHKKIWVVVGGNIRSNYAMSNSNFAVSVYDNNSTQLAWNVLPLQIAYLGINKWVFAKDSLLVPANYYNYIPSHISVHTYLAESAHENFDIDSMFVIIKVADY